jgi:OmpR-family two-component system manganese-sensing sensor histidine kinase
LLFLARQDSGIVQARRVIVPLDSLLRDVIEEQKTLAEEKGIQLGLSVIEPTGKGIANSTAANQSGISSGASLPSSAIAVAPPHPIQETWCTLNADRDQLARLFTNLVGNALQYTPSGGNVLVKLQSLKRSSNALLQVSVIDTGIGIPAEALPRLFDRFYRVDQARTQASTVGSGLGLAIAHAIVENHQGQLHIESVLAQGTTVTVALPQRDDG